MNKVYVAIIPLLTTLPTISISVSYSLHGAQYEADLSVKNSGATPIEQWEEVIHNQLWQRVYTADNNTRAIAVVALKDVLT